MASDKASSVSSLIVQRYLPPMAAIAVAVAIWWPLTIPLRGFLPTPYQVLLAFLSSVTGSALYTHLGVTLGRVLFGCVTSVVVGSMLGLWMGRSKWVEGLALPWVMVGLALPGPVVVIMAVLLFGVKESSSLLALWASVTPFVTNIVYQGARNLDPQLFEMTQVYRLARGDILRHVILPQLAPSLLAGARSGFAFSWKIVVIIEALSRPNGIGGEIHRFFRLLRPDLVVAWTLSFIVIMVAAEFLVFQTAERKMFSWRKEATW